MNKKLHLTISGLALLIFVLLAYFIKSDRGGFYLKHGFLFDRDIQAFAFSHRTGMLNSFFENYTQAFGDKGGMITAAILLILILIFKNGSRLRSAFYFGLSIVLALGVNTLLKHLFSRIRPTGHRLLTESGYSFPSGHAIFSTVMLGVLFFIIVATMQSRLGKFLLWGLTLILVLLVLYSRIYVGVHYPTDVLAGFLLGTAIVHLGYPLYTRALKR